MSAANTKKLVIVESPAKAQTIGRFLGKDFQVEASFGHLRDLPEGAKEIPKDKRGEAWARLGVNVESDFEPIYVVPSDKKKHVKRLKDALKQADHLLLATDEDREGESISWHVLELLKPKKSVQVERIVFHEVTPEAIAAALSSPRRVDENLVRAQEARRILDRLYGYLLSPLLWKRVAPRLSAGRVQSVAVRLLVERERDRIAFVPASYWDLKAELDTGEGQFGTRLIHIDGQRIADGKSFDAETGKLSDLRRRLLGEEDALRFQEEVLTAGPWKVGNLERKPGSQRPAPPFITSTLQQEGNRKLKMTSRQTMRVAQQLYEGIDLGGERVGLITYMRTDSVTLAERALEEAREVISEAYGSDYLPEQPIRYKTKGKRAQEAHEAIRPTDLSRRPQDVKRYLDADQYRLYEMVWKRTIACQMVPAEFERTAVEIEVDAGGETLGFAASGRRIVFPGFLRAYVEGSDDPDAQLGDQETLLPALELGQELEPLSVDAEGHSTKPPYRYTEASLVKKLEEEGIGRPSTYASIIATIQDRGYVQKRGNELIPTFTAFCVTQLLELQFADLVETHFTAKMEDDLDEIAAGRLGWADLVSRFYHGDGKPGLSKRIEDSEVTYPAIPLGNDPGSGDEIIVKVGKYGPYIRRGEGGGDNVATVPDDMAPDELTLAVAIDLLQSKAGEKPPIATDPVTGHSITLQRGRFGEYFELGQTDEEIARKEKPRRVSLPRGLESADVTPEIAQQLIQLPRSLGAHPDDDEELTTNIGRYGPYLKHGKDYRSLGTWQKACELSREEALAILKEPKKSGRRFGAKKTVLKELGELPGAAGPVKVLDGRYGPYVTDGETNATLPKGSDPAAVTVEQAKELLDAKRKAPKRRARRRA